MNRIYILNGKEISSEECDGFLHKARTPRGKCMACGKLVDVGQEYVLLNYYNCPDPLHRDCFIGDHPQHTIIGIVIRKKRRLGLMRTFVICKDFSVKEK